MATRPVPFAEDIEANHETPQPPKRITTGQFAVVYDLDTVWPKIIEIIANGRSLADALRQPGMPSYAQAKLHLRNNPELRELYEQAKLDRADAMSDDLVKLVDEPIPEHLQGAERGAWVQHRRLQADVRKWLMARIHPKAYSEKLQVDVTNTQISITAALAAANRRLENAIREEIDITPAADPERGS